MSLVAPNLLFSKHNATVLLRNLKTAEVVCLEIHTKGFVLDIVND